MTGVSSASSDPQSAPLFTVTDDIAPLDSILCTERLWQRPKRLPDYESENRALTRLVRALADSPSTILQTLADTVLEVLEADSAGLSLVDAPGTSFYWPAIAGAWQPHLGGGTPRNFGPCGDVLDCGKPLMFTHWERRYPYLLTATPYAEEGLLVPFYVNGRAVGTIWMISHSDRRKFDAEDLRQLESLGRFASAAYQAVQLQHVEEARRQAVALNEALRNSEEQLRGIFSQTLTGIAQVDLTGRFVQVNNRFCEMVGRSAADLLRLRTQDITHPDDVARNMALFGELAATGKPFVIEKRYVRPDGSEVWVNNSVCLLRDRDGKPAYVVAASLDITQQKEAEHHRNLLVAELSHRVKNTLATVISIAQQTFTSTPSTKEALTSFDARIRGLAQTHSLLAEANWSGVSLRRVIEDETAPYLGDDHNIRLTGPDVVLDPKTAVSLGMAIHELVTNAAKYGALSSKAGVVGLTWRLLEPERWLELDWREIDGPPVWPPTRRGFGRLLLERALTADLRGDVKMDFARDGLHCVIRLPLAEPPLTHVDGR